MTFGDLEIPNLINGDRSLGVGKTKRSRLLLDTCFVLGSVGMIGLFVLVSSFFDRAEHKLDFKSVKPVGLQSIKGMKATSIYQNLINRGFSQDIKIDTMVCKLDRYTVEIVGLTDEVQRVSVIIDAEPGEDYIFHSADKDLMGDIASVYYDSADRVANRQWVEDNFGKSGERDDGVALIETSGSYTYAGLRIRNSRTTSVGLLDQLGK